MSSERSGDIASADAEVDIIYNRNVFPDLNVTSGTLTTGKPVSPINRAMAFFRRTGDSYRPRTCCCQIHRQKSVHAAESNSTGDFRIEVQHGVVAQANAEEESAVALRPSYIAGIPLWTPTCEQ